MSPSGVGVTSGTLGAVGISITGCVGGATGAGSTGAGVVGATGAGSTGAGVGSTTGVGVTGAGVVGGIVAATCAALPPELNTAATVATAAAVPPMAAI